MISKGHPCRTGKRHAQFTSGDLVSKVLAIVAVFVMTMGAFAPVLVVVVFIVADDERITPSRQRRRAAESRWPHIDADVVVVVILLVLPVILNLLVMRFVAVDKAEYVNLGCRMGYRVAIPVVDEVAFVTLPVTVHDKAAAGPSGAPARCAMASVFSQGIDEGSVDGWRVLSHVILLGQATTAPSISPMVTERERTRDGLGCDGRELSVRLRSRPNH